MSETYESACEIRDVLNETNKLLERIALALESLANASEKP